MWCAVGAATVACSGDRAPALTAAERDALANLSPVALPGAPADPSNLWADDDAAARFGQILFFDPRLAGRLLDGDNDGSKNALGQQGETGRVSCAGCHMPEAGFSDVRSIDRQISLAAGWGRRRTPSLLDVAQSKLLMWDGRRDALYGQIFGVIESPVEMNSSRLFAARQIFLHHRADYEALFGAMPPLDDTTRFAALSADETGCPKLDAERNCTQPMRGAPGDGAEYDALSPTDQEAVTRVVVNVGKAMGAYQRRLACGGSRFDAWMHGDGDALSASEQRGAALFVGRAGCVTCHSGPFLSDEKFHNVGLRAERVATAFLNAFDRGAAEGLTQLQTDPLNTNGAYSDGADARVPAGAIDATLEGAFRTPRLRCVSGRPSFLHTGQMRTLEHVVRFFARGGDPSGYPGHNELSPLELADTEQADLVAFLTALDGPGPRAELLMPPPQQKRSCVR